MIVLKLSTAAVWLLFALAMGFLVGFGTSAGTRASDLLFGAHQTDWVVRTDKQERRR